MEWQKGYTASYYACRVDPVTWLDRERIEITGGSIKKENEGLLESCDISTIDYPYEDSEEYIRIYMDASQENAGTEHSALFTGLAVSPDKDASAANVKSTVTCYSVLKPAEDVYLQRGWYVPAGVNAASMIDQLLSVCPAPKEYDAELSPNMASSIIAEDDETNLSMVWKILQAINYRLLIDGTGTINIVPQASDDDISGTFDPVDYDVIETEIKIKRDWFECPNVYMAIDGDLTAIARDDDENSPLSTVNRNREIWRQDSSVSLADNESIEQYAQRCLKEAQQISVEASYNRRYIPGIAPTDNVQLNYPAQGLNGVYKVKSQSIDLGYGAKVSEEVMSL